MADNLPRPATPGPWGAVDDYNGDCGFACTPDGCLGHPSGKRTLDGPEGHDGPIEFADEQDAAAIAALPERVRRMDAVRALCEREASRGGPLDPCASLAREIRALLDGGGRR